MKRAREMLKRLVDEGLTFYETEGELGRGKRKKRPPTIYTDDDEDSDVPKHSKQQLLSDDSDSDSVQHKKIRKFGKSKKIVQDILAPPPLSFQHKTGSMSPDQNDKNRKIIVTVAHKNTGTALSLMEKIKSQQTERQGLLQKLKEGSLKNAFKKQKSALTVPQLNVCVKSPLQQMNATLYQDNVNSMGDEKENVIDESEVESNLGISSERQGSSKSSRSRDTEVVRPSCSTPLNSPSLHRMSPRNPEISCRQLFSCHRKMSQDANDAESLSFGNYVMVSCWSCLYFYINYII